ncbi:hypothetical protein M406DRAFT_355267 [Cryphonectria parasitica EP155]|uniref:Uncharacterized protein n=1 Tax=Cryphonectria parasitica (strain ATCC 38755 / EP155) TaxID=660469 RepID=A0A9P5CTG2_CRYP1|nr:uncharacterized protein M406DRAFT_355267 [Cryphonectria parasitica EP155]KAF3769386.1 hypothetical protein M406DRAFT_355267 [Cryphonectria parasitica EP155]
MWSLGCLYLEFVTWLLGGWEMVQQFAKLRMSVDATWYEMQIDTFFDLVKSDDGHEMGARVKPAVTKFIEQLHGHTFCSDFVHDFLDIIQHRLLVVLPQDTARNDAPGTGRVSCEQLDHELRRIRNLCQEDVEYASRPSPRV